MRGEVPLAGDHASRFLPWLLALLVYLAVLALAVTLALQAAIARWDGELAGTLTVQIGGPGAQTARPDELDRQAKRAAEILAAMPGVARARALDIAETAALLAPWLGSSPAIEELPLPRLVDVQLAPGASLDIEAATRALAAVASGVAVEDHRVWLANLARVVRAIEAISLAVIAFIAAVAIAGVVFVTRTGLALHRDTIGVLHMVGARDGYVARRFERHALALCAKGGIPAAALAAATAFALGRVGRAVEPTLLPALSLDWRQWLALLAVPLAAAAISVATARLTVLRTLARSP